MKELWAEHGTSVEVVDTLNDFASLQEPWEAIHAADRHATVFSSWPWLAGWLAASPDPWCVLVVRAGSQALGFLALSRKLKVSRLGLRREVLELAGHPVSNHTGLVCLPRAESEVLAALAQHLRRRRWTRLSFKLTSDPRLLRLAQRLAGGAVTYRQQPGSCSPYLVLEGDFEAYLQGRFSGKARRDLRRRQRKAEALGLTMTQVERPDELGPYLEAFLNLHQQRFGPLLPHKEQMYRCLFTRMQAVGALHFNVLWDDHRPVGSQIGFLDHKHGTYHGCQSGWDAAYSALAPGLLVRLEAIRYASEHGFRRVDFGRGEQDYKFALGAKRYHTMTLTLTRPDVLQQLKRRLMPWASPVRRA